MLVIQVLVVSCVSRLGNPQRAALFAIMQGANPVTHLIGYCEVIMTTAIELSKATAFKVGEDLRLIPSQVWFLHCIT